MKQHKLSYNIINSLLFIISSCKSRNNIELQRYLRLVRRQKSTSVTQKLVQVSVNSTGVLFTYL
jgi:Tfp pilus assembly protein PilP